VRKFLNNEAVDVRFSAMLVLCFTLALCTAVAQQPAALKAAPAKKTAPAAKASTVLPPPVSPAALRAHVSFLASDAMQGRNTPSHELDIAAEYIASEFRRIGLEPPTPAGYFQTSQASTSITIDGRMLSIPRENISGPMPSLIHARLFKISTAEGITKQQTSFRAILTTPEVAKQLQLRRRELSPHVIIAVEAAAAAPAGEGFVTFRDPELTAAYEKLPEGRTNATLSVIPAGLKNVIGVLPGADTKLRDQFVLVTAHYDHVGAEPAGEGDRIYNGANDNASGTASMIETAAVLTASRVKPKRSVAFIAFFGEEKGLVGSRYYASNPLLPIDRTVAQINLEQTGRTDDSEGPRVNGAIVTGFEFSELGAILQKTAAAAGIKIENVPQADDFFNRSDNEALASVGVPAHTVGVAFLFPDYHKPGDHWDKIDYDNMARVTQAIAASALAIANRTEPPHWLTKNPKAEEFWRSATPLARPREASAQESGNSPASPKPRRSKP
jgi:hypothetical protein